MADAGFIDRELRAVRQEDYRRKSPALVGDIPGYLDSLASQLGEGVLNVVAHEVELVMTRSVSRVNGELCRGAARK